jgi:short-subunit dehydrogenase
MFFQVFAALGLISFFTYVIPWIYQTFFFSQQDLKQKYHAKWALVTGASSGIGKALTEKLANQGINVVMVALDDQILKDSFNEIKGRFPNVEIRSCGADLSQGDYMKPITEITKDIDINLVFNNAGYITTGFYHDLPLERSLKNYECNATAALKITHHFLNKMIEKKQKGLITFTSSSAGFISCPLSSMYAATKCFLTAFGGSLAAEVKSFGIDVLVVHPSPIQSRFLTNSGGMKVLEMSGKVAASPSVIADTLFASAGRCVIRDQGLTSFFLKLLVKIVDWNFLTDLIPFFAHQSGDYQNFLQKIKQKK